MSWRAIGVVAVVAVVGGCGEARPSADVARTVLQVRDADSGRTRWTVELPTTGATEPVLAGDVVTVAPGGAGATAYGLADGRERWRLPDAQLPAAVAGEVVVFDLAGQLEAHDAGTGTVLWRRPAPGGQLVQSRESAGVLLLTDPERAAQPACGIRTLPAQRRPHPRVRQ